MAQGLRPNGAVESAGAPISWRRVIELVDSRRQDSVKYNSGIFNKLPRLYDNYRGYWQGALKQFRNQVSIPFTFAMIQGLVSRKVQALFGVYPYVGFEALAPEDQARARKNEVLISQQMDDVGILPKAIDFFLQEAICGTAVARIGWKYDKRKVRYRKLETIAPGLSVPVMYEGERELFNGPDLCIVDRLDFWQQPARFRIEDMDWAIHRYWMDYDSLVEDSKSPTPYFDPKAVKILKDYPLNTFSQDQWVQRKATFRNEYDYEARVNERFAKPVEIWEMHGFVPAEFGIDGIRHLCIAVANQRVVIKYRANDIQELPFVANSSMIDPYSFDGVGKAEIAFGPQRTADRLNNQRLDLIDLIIDPPLLANSATNINTQNLFSKAGRIFTIDGTVGEDNIRPLQFDLRGLQVGSQEIGELFSFMQLGTGETESLMGLAGGSRETARGFLGRQENALTRLAMETRIAEHNFMERVANAFRDRDRLWLPMPKRLKMLGSTATTNPITGLPEPPDMDVNYDDLEPDYRARAVGASQMIGKSIRQQNYIQLYQIMASNPAMAQLLDWGAFARQGFYLFDFKNVNELLVQKIPLVNQIAAQTGQSPESVAQMASTPLEQLSPNVLSQFVNAQPTSPMVG